MEELEVGALPAGAAAGGSLSDSAFAEKVEDAFSEMIESATRGTAAHV